MGGGRGKRRMQSRIYGNNIDERFHIVLICIHVANSSMAEDNVICKYMYVYMYVYVYIYKENVAFSVSQIAECHNQTHTTNSPCLILVA